MNTVRICQSCKKPLPADAPEGLCPECLVKVALGSSVNPSGTPSSALTNPSPVAGFTSAEAPSLEEVAKLFPQLEILELLGQGGMGVVYKARQKQLDRFIALKIMLPQFSRDPAFVERFNREARALAKLNHPNIVAIYDFGQTMAPQTPDAIPHPPLCFFIMEFVDGANLRSVIQSGKLTAVEALAIVPKLCDALQFAHDEGVVHRDIKPANILVDRRGRVKIADFGLAKLAGATDVSLTRSQQGMGTPQYMAPEQLSDAKSVDHRADIYSLGVVFYEMLTGELPMGRFALPSQKVQIDVRLDEIVLKALEREPARRYQHASEVRTQVENVTGTPELKSAFERTPPRPRVAETLDHRVSEALTVGLPGWFNRRAPWVQKLIQAVLTIIVGCATLVFLGFNIHSKTDVTAGQMVTNMGAIQIGQPSPWFTVDFGGSYQGITIHWLSASLWIGLVGVAAGFLSERLRRSRSGFDEVADRRKRRRWMVVMVVVAVLYVAGLVVNGLIMSGATGKAARGVMERALGLAPSTALEIARDHSKLPTTQTPGRRDFAFTFTAPSNHVLNAWLEFWRDGKLEIPTSLSESYLPARGDSIRAGLHLTTQDGDMAGVGSAGQMRFDWALNRQARVVSDISKLSSSSTSQSGQWRTNLLKEHASRLSWDNQSAATVWRPQPGEVTTVLAWTAHAGKSVSSSDLDWTEEGLPKGLPAVAILLRVRFDPVAPGELSVAPMTKFAAINEKNRGSLTKLDPASALPAADLLRQTSEKYGKLSTFSATGKIVSLVTPESGAAPTTIEHTFAINLARPEFYRVEWTNVIMAGVTMTGAAWSAGDGHNVLMNGNVSTFLNREMSLATATGISGGAAHTVPSLFFKDDASALHKSLTNATLLPEESVGRDLCHVITGFGPAGKYTLWITKKDLFLKQSRTAHAANSGLGTASATDQVSPETMRKLMKTLGQDASPEAFSKRTNRMAAMKQKAGAMQITITETFEHIVVNELMIKEDFEVAVPAAAAAPTKK